MPLLQKRGTQMLQVSNSIQSFFPARVWGKTSEAPMCSNPNCCSNTSWVEQRNITNLENEQSTGKCTHEQHNKHCCKAEGNTTCAPGDWRVLYQQFDPEREDMLRRKWMTHWLTRRCTLHEAVTGFENEWGSCEAGELGVAA